MDFNFTKDQDMIRETVRKFLENECPKEKIRELKEDDKGYDPDIWNKMLELGWMGLVIPEEYDGIGAEYLDLMIIMEEMGRNVFMAPFFSTVALCSLPIIKFGSDEQKKNILPGIACGGDIWSFALLESSVDYEATGIELGASPDGDGYKLNGTKLFVPYANVSGNLLVASRTGKKDNPEDGITVFIVDANSPGITTTVMPTAACDKRCEVKFDSVTVPANNILGEKDKGWEIIEYIYQYSTVLKCAEISGAAQAAMELTNQYAQERIQFDKPIGSLQAIQHRIVNMLSEIDGLRNIVYEAAWKVNIGSPDKMLISIAKTKANNVYERVCLDGVSVHGAIGITDEMDIGLYFVMTKSFEFELGSTNFHRERIAKEFDVYKPLYLSMWDK